MRERLVYLADEETIPNSGTFIKNIDVIDPITAIDLIFEAQTGATSCVDHEIHDDVSKIEVVDGADVLHSLSMQEEMALNCYETGKFPWFEFSERPGQTVRQGCTIFFGRGYRDQEIYLNPKNFRNPQLRINYSLTISATAGFATGTGKITAIAHVLEDVKGTYKGFLMSKEHYSYTASASSHEYIDLPTDYKYRGILLRALRSTYGWDAQIDRIKLHADREKFVKLDARGRHLFQQAVDRFGTFVQKKTLHSADADTALLDLYNILQVSAFSTTADQIAQYEDVSGEQVTLGLYNWLGASNVGKQSSAQPVTVSAEGYQPMSCLYLPMGDMDDPEEYWDVTKYGSVVLDILTTSSGSGSMNVVIQQLRT
jgi:hypothetical protein